MRPVACLALILSVAAIAAGGQGTLSASDDVYQIANVNSMIAMQVQAPGISIGSLEKHNNQLGDAAAIAIIKIFPVSALTSPENVRKYLPVIAAAFEYPKLILRSEDQRPYVTYVLLDFLQQHLKDEALITQVRNLTQSLAPLLRGSSPDALPTVKAIAVPLIAENAPFSVKVEPTLASVPAGSKITLSITLTNVAKYPISARQTIRPDESEWDYVIDTRDARGEPVQPTNYERNRREIVRLFERHIRTLNPGESLVGEITLSKLFDLTVPGEYSVQVSRDLDDRESEPIVKSNTATITVTPF